MLITTTPGIEGRPVTEYLGIVTAQGVLGVNAFKDVSAGVRNIFGGRAKSYENELASGVSDALAEMEKQAAQLGADAVVGVDVDYESVGSNMLMAGAATYPAEHPRSGASTTPRRDRSPRPPCEIRRPARGPALLSGCPDEPDRPLRHAEGYPQQLPAGLLAQLHRRPGGAHQLREFARYGRRAWDVVIPGCPARSVIAVPACARPPVLAGRPTAAANCLEQGTPTPANRAR